MKSRMSQANPSPGLIRDRFFEGERPLFGLEHTSLENVRIYPGESALKHTQNLVLKNCEFMGMYPLWHSECIRIENSKFTPYSRAAIWYTHNLEMANCVVEAPKIFRSGVNLKIKETRFPNAVETLWNCREVKLNKVEMRGADYVFLNSEDIEIDHLELQGKYSFQDVRNVTIRDSFLDSKDAFWGSENVTVYNSILEGEFLGWHSKNLRLVNCTIRGSQPLCYAVDLRMENCRMENTDLCFEYSTVDANIVSNIISIKNPRGGVIRARCIGEIIIDQHCAEPGACRVETACMKAV